MPKLRRLLRNCYQFLLLVAIVAAAVYLISRNLKMSWNIFLAVMGFSAVVFIHECGHFILAKLANIKIETFSVFLPPVLLGIRRTENGFRFRILPKFFPKENDPEGDGLLSFTVGRKGRAGETEYRLGLVPLAGYVKMLGQEDIGADKQSDDPRSFSNKRIGVRMMVIVAGVAFNVIAAVGLLMMVYLIGMNQIPPVVGGVVPGSPAAVAGLRAGDEIIEIAGKSDNLDFGNLMMAAALADTNEAVPMRIRHQDGTEEKYAIVPERKGGDEIKSFGIAQAQTLTIAKLRDEDERKLVSEKTGLIGGDQIKAVNGQPVQTHWEFERIIADTVVPEMTLLAERTDGNTNQTKQIESKVIRANLYPVNSEEDAELELSHVYSMVPRLRLAAVSHEQLSAKDKLTSLLGSIGILKKADPEPQLESGDIVLAIGDVENPTYAEFRRVTTEYEDKRLPIKVLRTKDGGQQTLIVTVQPKRTEDDNRVVIGIFLAPAFDAMNPVVAKTIATESGPAALAIPRGAVITGVDGAAVSDFYDIIRQIHARSGRPVKIDYRLSNGQTGNVTFDGGNAGELTSINAPLAEFVPFRMMERLYKAEGPLDAFVMACKKSVWFIAKTYVTLKALFIRNVSLKAMAGPVGIATLTYRAVEHSFVSLMYLLAFISANLAVINFLPLPVVDGGVFILLIVEKIKGAPVNIRVQEAINYAGLALLGTVFIYITYHDFIRLFFGW